MDIGKRKKKELRISWTVPPQQETKGSHKMSKGGRGKVSPNNPIPNAVTARRRSLTNMELPAGKWRVHSPYQIPQPLGSLPEKWDPQDIYPWKPMELETRRLKRCQGVETSLLWDKWTDSFTLVPTVKVASWKVPKFYMKQITGQS